MPADPLLSLGRILGSFKLTLKPLSTLKNDIQSLSPPGSPGSSLWHTNNMYSCQEKSSIIKMYSFLFNSGDSSFLCFYSLQSRLTLSSTFWCSCNFVSQNNNTNISCGLYWQPACTGLTHANFNSHTLKSGR